MPDIAHIDHPAAVAFRMTSCEVEKLLNEHDQLRQSYDYVCKERDEARAQAAELAEQVDELRAENSRVQASAGALCAEVTAEGEEHAKTIARETCLAPPPERKPLGLRAGPAMLTTPEWADQIVEPTDRRVPLYPDRGRV